METQQKHIFVAEDDPDILEVLQIILSMNGYQVTSVSRGDEVMAAVKKSRPDLVMMDIWMPGRDGTENAKEIKAEPELQHLPVILLSAVSDIETIASSVKAEAFVKKPFDIDELMAVIKKFLE